MNEGSRHTRSSRRNSKENFPLNEATRANLQVNRRILKWQPFWNKVYAYTLVKTSPEPSISALAMHAQKLPQTLEISNYPVTLHDR